MVVGVFFLNLCVCATYSPGMHHAWIHRGSGRLGHHDAAAASMLASQPKVGHAWRAHALMKDGSLVAKRIACPLSLPGPGKRRLHAKATLRAATASHLLSFPCMTHNASTRNIQKKKKFSLSTPVRALSEGGLYLCSLCQFRIHRALSRALLLFQNEQVTFFKVKQTTPFKKIFSAYMTK